MDQAAILVRLARKYQADDIRTHFTEVFKSAWPNSFDDWDLRQRDMARIWNEPEAEGIRDSVYAESWSEQVPDPSR